jgi:hypothetical protein
MEAPLEIRYASVVIGRAQEVRNAEGVVPTFFLTVRDPMPVGTVLHLRTGDHETPARVVRAVESADPSLCGMQVRIIGEAEEVAPEFIPQPAVLAEKVKPVSPMVVGVDMEGIGADTATKAVAPEEPPAASEISTPAEAVAPAKTEAEAAPAEAVVPAKTEAEAAPAEAVVPAKTEAEAAPAPASPSGETAALPESAASEPTKTEDLPPARPIEPSGRRKTRRRR